MGLRQGELLEAGAGARLARPGAEPLEDAAARPGRGRAGPDIVPALLEESGLPRAATTSSRRSTSPSTSPTSPPSCARLRAGRGRGRRRGDREPQLRLAAARGDRLGVDAPAPARAPRAPLPALAAHRPRARRARPAGDPHPSHQRGAHAGRGAREPRPRGLAARRRPGRPALRTRAARPEGGRRRTGPARDRDGRPRRGARPGVLSLPPIPTTPARDLQGRPRHPRPLRRADRRRRSPEQVGRAFARVLAAGAANRRASCGSAWDATCGSPPPSSPAATRRAWSPRARTSSTPGWSARSSSTSSSARASSTAA